MDTARGVRRSAIIYGLIAVAVFQGVLGLYAAALNDLFYSKFGPFYDSMSYLNNLSDLQFAAQAKGRFVAFLDASFRSTMVYPWLVFAPFAKTAAIARSNGVWIQIAAAATMQFMLFVYFYRTRSLPFLQAVVFSTVFCLIAAVFRYNGGLSDFRMDLLQYLLIATVMASYLIARQSHGIAWWFVLGCFSGLLCLGRATSPVYIVPIFAIFAGVDLVLDMRNWRRIVAHWMIAGVVTAVVSGWYFVGNFERLHFYYFIWNEDANARLPLAVSIRHLGLLLWHVGWPLLGVLVATAVITVVGISLQQSPAALRRINWRALMFSAVPVGYLVLSGAGLNPFVSMVACAELIMFLLDPIEGPRPRFAPLYSVIVIGVLAGAGLSNAAQGIANHQPDDAASAVIGRQEGISKVIELITRNAQRHGANRVYTYAVAHVGSLDAAVLENSLIYDHGFRPAAGGGLAGGACVCGLVIEGHQSQRSMNGRSFGAETMTKGSPSSRPNGPNA